MDNCYSPVWTLLLVCFSLTLFSQSSAPCDCAQRWTDGGAWDNGAVDDTPPNNAPAKGIIKCASQAGTQPNVNPVNSCTYDPDDFTIDVTGLGCIDPSDGSLVPVLNPTAGQPIIWVNFDVREFAGNFEIQINDNSGDNIGWALYLSDEHTTYVSHLASGPNTATWLSGLTPANECPNFTLIACGSESSSTWNNIPIDQSIFDMATNWYLAIWDQDADGEVSINNFKARYGCGSAEFCQLLEDSRSIECVDEDTYQVVVDLFGQNGTWTVTDNTATPGVTFVTNPSPLTFTNGSVANPVVFGTVTATYPIGVDYNFSVTKTAGPDPYFGQTCDLTFTGTDPDLPVCNITDFTDVQCDGTLGTITFTVSGGTPANPDGYDFEILDSNNDPVTNGTTDGSSTLVQGFAAGSYTLKITDGINCMQSCPFTIDPATNCCDLDVTCPGMTDPGIYDCNNPIPGGATTEAEFEAVYGDLITGTPCGPVTVEFDDDQTPDYCAGNTVTRTYTISDGTTTVMCPVVFTIQPAPALVLDCPDDMTIPACTDQNSINLAFASWLLSFEVSGGCNASGQFAAAYSAPSFCGGSVEVTYNVTDDCGQTSCVKTFTVLGDNELPVLTCPDDADLGCNPASTAGIPDAIPTSVGWTDNCDGAGTTSDYTDSAVDLDGCEQGLTRTFTYTDACGNTGTCSVTYTWTVDTDLPVLTCPDDADLGCNPASTAGIPDAIPTSVGWTDNCDGTGTTSDYTDSAVDLDGCEQGLTRTFTYTDACGNTGTCSVTYTWTVDTDLPVLTCPDDADLGCNPASTAGIPDAIPTSVGWTDNCDGTGTTSDYTDSAVDLDGCEQGLTRTFTYTDACGNTGTCSVTYTWTVDTDLPVLTCPDDADLGCNPASTAGIPNAIPTSVGWTDNCDGAGTTSDYTDSAVDLDGCEQGLTRTFTYTDACGNTGTCSVTYTWTVDTDLPVLTCPDDADLGCNPASTAGIPDAIPTSVGWTDNCDGAGTTSDYTDSAVDLDGCEQGLTRTFTYTDACGNTGTCSVTYTWTVDTDLPVLTCPDDADLGCNPASTAGIPDAIPTSVGWTDNCDGAGTTSDYTDSAVDLDGCEQGLTRTFTYTDACGNTGTCSVTYTWTVDTDLPVLTCPDDADLGCNPASTAGIPDAIPTSVGWTDNCDGAGTTNDYTDSAVDLDGCEQGLTRTFTYTDACGNTGTCSVTYTWTVDTDLPVLTCPDDADLGCNPASTAGIPDAIPTSVGWTDNCDGTGTTSDYTDSAVDLDGCEQGLTRTFTYTDACGNTGTCSVTYTWTVDTDLPVLTCPDDADLGCNPASTAGIPDAIPTSVGWTDNCDGAGTTNDYTDSAVDLDGCEQGLTRTFTYTDACSNTGTCSVTYTWTVDTEDPTLVFCPVGGELGCNPDPSEYAPGTADWTDNCSLKDTWVVEGTPSNIGCAWSVTHTYYAIDNCDRQSSCTQTFTWTVDLEKPTLVTCPPGGDLGCNPDPAAYAPGTAEWTDNCGTKYEWVDVGIPSNNGCVWTVTHTYSAKDHCDNQNSCTQTFTWTVATEDPVLTCPDDADLGCNPASTAGIPNAIPTSVNYTDNCAGSGTTSDYTDSAVDLDGCEQGLTRTFTYTDACGNTGTCSVTYTWTVDTDLPVLTCPDDADLGCNPASTAGIPDAIPTSVGWTDNCDGAGTTSDYTDSAVDLDGCEQGLTRTFTYTDACGNTGTCSVTYTWTVDTDLPVLTCPDDADLGCNPASTAGIPDAIPTSVGWTDNCDGTGTTSDYTDSAVDLDGCEQGLTRTFTYTDACSNTGTCSVTYTWTVDTDLPVLTCPDDADLGCNPASTAGIPDAIPTSVGWTDNCDGAGTTSDYTDSAVDLDGCEQGLTRTFTYTDACGNTGTCSVTYTWTVDTDLPVLTCPDDADLGCNPASTAGIPDAIPTSVGWTDNCDGTGTTSDYTDSAVDLDGCEQGLTRTFTYTDACGNTGTCSVTYTWTVDTDLPVLTCPDDADLGCNPASTAGIQDAIPTSVGWTDNCDGAGTTSDYTDSAVDLDGCEQGLTRTFTYTDACGNTGTCSVTYTWTVDTDLPVLTCPDDADLGCNPASTAGIPDAIPTSVGWTDNCDGAGTTSDYTDSAVDLDGCEQGLTRTFTYTDACGNTGTCSVTYTWTVDTDLPVLTCPDDADLGCNPASTAGIPDAIPTSVGWTDNCDGAGTTSDYTDSAVDLDGCEQGLTRTFTYTDACGNTGTCSVTYTWTVDTDLPVLTCPDDADLGCNPASTAGIPDAIPTSVGWTDNCDGAGTTSDYTDSAVDLDGCEQGLTRTFTYTDACGNTGTCSVTYTWTVDTDLPVLTCPDDADLGCNPASTAGIPDAIPTSVGWTDNCDGAGTTSDYTDSAVDLDGCEQGLTRTFTYTDACGNTGTCSVTYTWTVDTDLPVLTCPDDADLGCNPASTAGIPNAIPTSVGWTDNCDGAGTTSDYTDSAVDLDGCEQGLTRTFTYTDACGNTGTCSVTYTWKVTPPLSVVCPDPVTVGACTSQTDIDAAYANWLAGFSTSGGCNPTSTDLTSYQTPPTACTDVDIVITINYSASDDCNEDECSSTFTIPAMPDLTISCPDDVTLEACLSQEDINEAFENWLAEFDFEGGCSPVENFNGGDPSSSDCTNTFTNTVCWTTPAISHYVLGLETCLTADNIAAVYINDVLFTDWAVQVDPTCGFYGLKWDNLNLDDNMCAEFKVVFKQSYLSQVTTGYVKAGPGCTSEPATGPACTPCSIKPPLFCEGGSVMIVYQVTDECGQTEECTATFTVPERPEIEVICPAPVTVGACTSQADINTAYATWLGGFQTIGGCSPTSTDLTPYQTPPTACSDGPIVITIHYEAWDDCNEDDCSSTFTIPAQPGLSVVCPAPVAVGACTSQADINTAYATWLAGFQTIGGCSPTSTDLTPYQTPPTACSDGPIVITIHYEAWDDCNEDDCSSTFTIPAQPGLSVVCSAPVTVGACTSQADINTAYATWLAGFQTIGGCSPTSTDLTPYQTPPTACSDGPIVITIHYEAWDDCNEDDCSSTFTIPAQPGLSVVCPAPVTVGACTSQADINTAYATWLAGFQTIGGCSPTSTDLTPYQTPPTACSDDPIVITIHYEAWDDCNEDDCSSTFTIPAQPGLSVVCPAPVTVGACTSQADINTAYATWLAGFQTIGGCSPTSTDLTPYQTPPTACSDGPIVITIHYEAWDDCNEDDCSSTFTIPAQPGLSVVCPAPVTVGACTSQADINTAYATWLAGFQTIGGCSPTSTDLTPYQTPPTACSDGPIVITIHYEAWDDCNEDDCSSTFTIPAQPGLSVVCPAPVTVGACTSQADINTAYATWLGGFQTIGGCSPTSTDLTPYQTPPTACSDGPIVITIHYEAWDDCNEDDCSSTFTIPAQPGLSVVCPAPVTVGACTSQADINTAYATWLGGFQTIGGCSPTSTDLTPYQTPPTACSDGPIVITIHYEAWDDCNEDDCSSTFTIPAQPGLSVVCPAPVTVGACTSQADINTAYATWLAGFQTIGGCSPTSTNLTPYQTPPSACGDEDIVITINYGASDDCNSASCSSTFTLRMDMENPTLVSCPEGGELGCNPEPWEYAPNEAEWTDNCDIAATWVVAGTPSNVGCVWSVTHTYYAKDQCNNQNSCSQTFTWTVDTDAPIITATGSVPNHSDLGCNPTPEAIEAALGTATALDNCGDVTPVRTNGEVQVDGCFRTQTRSWNATDACGNAAVTVSRTITWKVDTEAPVIICPADVVGISCNQPLPEPDISSVSVTDNCCVPEVVNCEITEGCITVTFISQTVNSNGSTTYSIRVTNHCGQDVSYIAFSLPAGVEAISPADGSTFVGALGSYHVENPTNNPFYSIKFESIGDPFNPGEEETFQFILPGGSAPASFDVQVKLGQNIYDLNITAGTCYSACEDILVEWLGDESNEGAGCAGDPLIITRTYRATDGCNNSATCTQRFIYATDTEDPVITYCPPGGDLGCNPDEIPQPDPGALQVSEDCGVDYIDVDVASSTNGCNVELTYTYTVYDLCGNSASCTQTFEYSTDTEGPEITFCPPGADLGCNPSAIPDPDPDAVQATDNCGIDHVSVAIASSTDGCHVERTYTYTVHDLCGNTSSCDQVFTYIIDADAPVITPNFPAQNGQTILVECNNLDPTWDPFTMGVNDITVTDACSDYMVTFEDVLVEEGICGVSDFLSIWKCLWTVTDACGNTSQFLIYMKIVDTKPPVFTLIPPDIHANCGEVPDLGYAKAEDACSNVEITLAETTIPGDCYGDYTLVRTFTAIDDCGNQSSVTQYVYYSDHTPPILYFVDEDLMQYQDGQVVYIDCNQLEDVRFFTGYEVLGWDECLDDVDVTYSYEKEEYENCIETGYLFGITSTWTGTDACGNSSQLTLYFRLVDNTPPTLHGVPADACVTSMPPMAQVTATDNCDAVSIKFDQSPPQQCGNGAKYVVRTWTARDGCGNTTTASQTIVMNDDEGPEVSIDYPGLSGVNNGEEGTIEAVCGAEWGLPDIASLIVVADNCSVTNDPELEVTLLDEGNCAADGYLYRVAVKITASDVCGNETAYELTIRVIDTKGPEFVNTEPEITISCSEFIGVPEAVDECSGIASITVEDLNTPANMCHTTGQPLMRKLTAIDNCGNVTEFIQKVHVEDFTGPVLTGVPEDGCGDPGPAPAVTALDECTGTAVPVTFAETTLNGPCGSVLQRTWKATDACGNVTETTRYYSLEPNAPFVLAFNHPDLVGLASGGMITLSCNQAPSFPDILPTFGPDAVVVAAGCPANVEPSLETQLIAAGNCKANGYLARYLYTWTATDVCGNVGELELIVEFVDDTAPTMLNIPANVTIYCDEPIPSAPEIEVIDDCGPATVTLSEQTWSNANGYFLVRTWTTKDVCGNTDQATQIITVIDYEMTCNFTQPGVVKCGSKNNKLTVNVQGGQAPYTYHWDMVDCDGFITDGQGTKTIRFTAGFTTLNFEVTITDANGCSKICYISMGCIKNQNGPGAGQDNPGGNIVEPGSEHFNLYPNPASRLVNVDATAYSGLPGKLEVIDILGKPIRALRYEEIPESSIELDMSEFINGTYLIRLTVEGLPPVVKPLVIVRN